jgi:hypothetical protein
MKSLRMSNSAAAALAPFDFAIASTSSLLWPLKGRLASAAPVCAENGMLLMALLSGLSRKSHVGMQKQENTAIFTSRQSAADASRPFKGHNKDEVLAMAKSKGAKAAAAEFDIRKDFIDILVKNPAFADTPRKKRDSDAGASSSAGASSPAGAKKKPKTAGQPKTPAGPKVEIPSKATTLGALLKEFDIPAIDVADAVLGACTVRQFTKPRAAPVGMKPVPDIIVEKARH